MPDAPAHLNVAGNEIVASLLFQSLTTWFHMNKFAILKEFWEFLKVSKKWWLAPIVLFLLVLGVLLVAAKGSALAPFIYSLF